MPCITAYVDEAVPRTGANYLLACAVVVDDQADEIRARLVRAKLPVERKVHWHSRRPTERTSLIDGIAPLPVKFLLVVRPEQFAEPPERSRRKCIERLVWLVDQNHGVEDMIFEARETQQNENDRRLLGALRARRIVSAKLRMRHVPGPREPLLWLPDVIAGAYSSLLQGDREYFAPLEDAIKVVEADQK